MASLGLPRKEVVLVLSKPHLWVGALLSLATTLGDRETI